MLGIRAGFPLVSSIGNMLAHLQRIATAVPANDVHGTFVDFASGMLIDDRTRSLFLRMAERAGIDHRFSVLNVNGNPAEGEPEAHMLYRLGNFPSTATRMHLFERTAPLLLHRALNNLRLTPAERDSIGHVIVTCCTGMVAPGLDFAVVDHLGLPPGTERTNIGFMGCYAAINGLKLARHIVRSEPGKRVLLVNLELCTLHFQETQQLGEVLSFLVFADGCAASLIGADPVGLAMDRFEAIELPGTRDLITWRVRDSGFDMALSGKVPLEIGRALAARAADFAGMEVWAVHPGGRTVLDAVQQGLRLSPHALDASRDVLCRYGNMSSATVMFVLRELLAAAKSGQRGCAMSFGPGLTAETMRFHVV